MLLALPVIVAAIASYFQFTLVRYAGYGGFRPLMWDALEELKGVMRRRMPFWMQPISAATPMPTLTAPIPTNNLSVTITNQTLMIATTDGVPTSGLNNTPFELPSWIALRLHVIQTAYFCNVLCGTVVFLCLAGFYALWTLRAVTKKSTARDHQLEHTGRLKSAATIAHPLVPPTSVLDSVSGLISPNPATTDLQDSSRRTARVPGPVNPSLPGVLSVPPSCFGSPHFDSNSPSATVSESTWEALRVPSSIESPDPLDINLSRHWHREVIIAEGFPYDTSGPQTAPNRYSQRDVAGRSSRSIGPDHTATGGTGTGSVYPTPNRLPVIREEPPSLQTSSVPRIIAEEHQESSGLLLVDSSRPVELPSDTGAPATRSLVADDSTEGTLTIDGSTISGPEPALIGGTQGSLRIQINLHDLEGNLVPGSSASATWVGFVALRDSLVHLCPSPAGQASTSNETDGSAPSSMEDMSGHNNAWVDHLEKSMESLISVGGAHSVANDSNGDSGNNNTDSESTGCACTPSSLSTFLEWISDCSLSTHADTPLITPSSSMPLTQSDDSSCTAVPPDAPGSSTDFIFEDQLSQIASPPTTQFEDTDTLASFADVQPNGSWSMDSDTVPTSDISSETQMLQSFLDDRSYAEVAGVPSDIESAPATISLRRWKIPRPGPQRPLANGSSPYRAGRREPDLGAGNWAGHGTSNSMWARGPDPYSRGFESRRERARRAQQV